MSSAPSPNASPSGSGASRNGPVPSNELAACVVDAMAERKAADIAVMDLRAVGGVADFFVVATGGSDRQIRAVANAIEVEAKERLDERPWHTEGKEHLEWVVLDYVNVVVHLFSKAKREYYDLERLWGDADIEHVPDEDGAAVVALLQPERSGDERPASEE